MLKLLLHLYNPLHRCRNNEYRFGGADPIPEKRPGGCGQLPLDLWYNDAGKTNE